MFELGTKTACRTGHYEQAVWEEQSKTLFELIPVELYICVVSNMTHKCFCNNRESWRNRPGRQYMINNIPGKQYLNFKAAGVKAMQFGRSGEHF